MLFLSSVSFAQQQKQVTSPKQKKNVILNLTQQAEMEQKKLRDYEAEQKNMTPERKIQQEAQKIQAQIKEKEKNLALKNAEKSASASFVDPRSHK